jgi:hypothetical protein
MAVAAMAATAIVAASCGGSGGSGSATGDGGAVEDGTTRNDSGSTSHVDSGSDGGSDSRMSSEVDSGSNRGADSGSDSGTDAESSSADSGSDGGTDAGSISADSGSDSGNDAGSEGGTDTGSSIQCPSGMLVVPVQGASAYCIDAVEVTYAEYTVFYDANPTTASQPASCAWNVGWTPSGAWPNSPSTGDEPVRYVNWCQADAYCTYAGKHLCGAIGGGSAAPANFKNASTDQWFNACSAQGENLYPYGVTYNASDCNGGGSAGPAVYESWLTCQGGEPGVYNMSGNVAEWEDACSASTGATDACPIRGGSYLDGSGNLRCDSDQTSLPITQPRSYAGNDVGFRCCL